jgi:hypothetical protein
MPQAGTQDPAPDDRGAPDVYRWLWDHLPGPTAVKGVIAAAAAALVVAALLFSVQSLIPVTAGPAGDGSGSDQDGVIEPDGVRQSPTVPPSDELPTPSVPEDVVPQQ